MARCTLTSLSPGKCFPARDYYRVINHHCTRFRRYPDLPGRTASGIMKCLVAVIGAICLALIFLVERLSNIFSLGITISGITAGVYLGAFTLGILCPRANAKGVLCGSYAALIVVAIIAVGAQLNVMNGNLKYPTLPFRTDGCSSDNSTDLLNLSSVMK